MKNTIYSLQNIQFESSTRETEQFKNFALMFRKELVAELKKNVGIKEFTFSRGHFYVSGFFRTLKDKVYYFSISDVRHFKIETMLIRTAKDFNDFSGGGNNWITLKENMFKNSPLVVVG